MHLKIWYEHMVQNQLDYWKLVLDPKVSKIKSLDFPPIFLTNRVWPKQAKSWKWAMYVQDTALDSCVNQHDFIWMYDILYESTHTQLWFRSKQNYFKIQNSNFAYLWTNEPQNGYSDITVSICRCSNALSTHAIFS